MIETPEQYIARMLSHVGDRDPMAVLKSTPTRLRELVECTPEAGWRKRPAADRWSAREVLAHLADAEIVTGWRLRSILARDGVALQPFDQNVWASVFKYEDADERESLATFSAARTSLLSVLTRVDRAKLEHHGMHAERGKETIHHLMRLYAGHDLNHLGQIERLVIADAT